VTEWAAMQAEIEELPSKCRAEARLPDREQKCFCLTCGGELPAEHVTHQVPL
jgi:hypothetical protein